MLVTAKEFIIASVPFGMSFDEIMEALPERLGILAVMPCTVIERIEIPELDDYIELIRVSEGD